MTETEIAFAIHLLKLELKNQQLALEGTRKRINTEIKNLQKMCPHTKTSFESDPSGGNDSYIYCDSCREEF